MPETQKSYWLKSGLLTILERGSVFVFGFGGFYLLTRALSLSDLGIWVLFYTITSFIEVGRNGLLQNALVKYLTNASAENYGLINSASIFINGLLTILFLILLLGLSYPAAHFWFNAPVLADILWIYCITAIVMIPFTQMNFIQMANLDFRGTFWSNFTRQGLFFVFILVVVLYQWEISLVMLAMIQVLTTLVGTLVNYFFARRYIQFSRQIDWAWVKKLFHFGRYVFGTNISTMVYKSIDKLMLGSLLLPASVGIYEWAIKITNLTEVPTFSIASIVFPQAAKKAESGGKSALKDLYEKSVGAILGIIVPFILIVWFFAEPIILLLAGEAFLETVPVLHLTIFFGVFIPFAVLFGTILDAMGKPRINYYFTIAGAIINIISNFIFIKLYGIKGAAYGTLCSYAVTFALQQYVLNKILGVQAHRALIEIPGFYRQGIKLARNFWMNKITATKTET